MYIYSPDRLVKAILLDSQGDPLLTYRAREFYLWALANSKETRTRTLLIKLSAYDPHYSMSKIPEENPEVTDILTRCNIIVFWWYDSESEPPKVYEGTVTNIRVYDRGYEVSFDCPSLHYSVLARLLLRNFKADRISSQAREQEVWSEEWQYENQRILKDQRAAQIDLLCKLTAGGTIPIGTVRTNKNSSVGFVELVPSIKFELMKQVFMDDSVETNPKEEQSD